MLSAANVNGALTVKCLPLNSHGRYYASYAIVKTVNPEKQVFGSFPSETLTLSMASTLENILRCLWTHTKVRIYR